MKQNDIIENVMIVQEINQNNGSFFCIHKDHIYKPRERKQNVKNASVEEQFNKLMVNEEKFRAKKAKR